jgi:hypothetical protein
VLVPFFVAILFFINWRVVADGLKFMWVGSGL